MIFSHVLYQLSYLAVGETDHYIMTVSLASALGLQAVHHGASVNRIDCAMWRKASWKFCVSFSWTTVR